MSLTWTLLGIVSLLWAALFLVAWTRRMFGRPAGHFLATFAAVEVATVMLFLTFYQPRPNAALVDAVERHLAAHACAGPIEGRREFRFAKAGNGTADRRWVTFFIRRAPQPSRQVLGVRQGWPRDDSTELLARGRYEVASDRLSVDYCGITLGARHQN